MRQSKIFCLPQEKEEFNEFIKTNPPIGENGLKLQTNYIFLQYEDGVILSQERYILSLKAELNTLISNSIEEERQFRDSIKTRDSFSYNSEKYKWEQCNDALIPQLKACQLTRLKIDVITEMLSDMGQTIEFTHRKLPEPSLPENYANPNPSSRKKK